MQQITIGTLISFLSFSKPKELITAKVIKIFKSNKDGKMYCQVKKDNKIFSKQLDKVKINEKI